MKIDTGLYVTRILGGAEMTLRVTVPPMSDAEWNERRKRVSARYRRVAGGAGIARHLRFYTQFQPRLTEAAYREVWP